MLWRRTIGHIERNDGVWVLGHKLDLLSGGGSLSFFRFRDFYTFDDMLVGILNIFAEDCLCTLSSLHHTIISSSAPK